MIPRASLLIPLTLALLASGAAAQVTPGGDAAKKEYWLARSKPLAPKDPRAVRAMEIFEKTLAAADKRPGPRPELVILDEAGYPWARSLPDGTILLTRGAMDVALRAPSPAGANARLAFIIGHELSHHVNGDFWHFFFYQGLHPGDAPDDQSRRALEEVIGIARRSDDVTAKELMADQYGLLYASQAGYNVGRVVAADTNFFREWAAATSPDLLEGVVMTATHPKIEERAAAARATLGRVTEKIELFDRGVAAYHAGDYEEARRLFEDFLAVYQSREAFNNLGLAYYQLALAEKLPRATGEAPLRLSVTLEPVTRARSTLSTRRRSAFSARADGEQPSAFSQLLTRATRYFRDAVERDPWSATALNNLACAYYLAGENSSAVGELDRAVALSPESSELYNNRAAALLRLGETLKADLTGRAEADLQRAVELKPDYVDALFNLAWMYKTSGKIAEKERYAARLAQAAPGSPLLALLR